MSYIYLPPIGSGFFQNPVATFGDLPASDVTGTVRLVQADGLLYYYNGSSWVPADATTGTYYKPPVANAAALPAGDADYTVRLVQDEGDLYYTVSDVWSKIVQTGSLSSGTQAANTATGVAASGSWGAVTSVSLAAGTWLVQGTVGFNENGAVLENAVECGVSDSATGVGISEFDTTVAPFLISSTSDALLPTPLVQVSPAVTTTYYLNTRFYYTSGTPRHRGRIQARKIG